MQAKAHLKILRTSPRKVRLVADTVRGLPVEKALGKLEYDLRSAAPVISKLVKSAVANAAHNDNHVADDLFITDIQVGEGPTLKRFRARAYGRAFKILKRTSKITVVLSNDDQQEEKAKKSASKEPAVKKAAKKAASNANHPERDSGSTKKESSEKTTAKASAVDDLTKIEGIGPKIAEVLGGVDIKTFADLAKQNPEAIAKHIEDVRGSHDPTTWPRQAELARDEKWDELAKWQDELDGGKA